MTNKPSMPHPATPPSSCRYLLILMIGVIVVPIAPATESDCTRPMTDVIPMLEKMERAWIEVSDYSKPDHRL